MSRTPRTRKPKTETRAETPRRLARSRALPGLEDRAIRPLEDLAAAYAEMRDQRMELGRREAALKSQALALMKKLDRAVYRRDGIEITIVPGADDVKVKVKKAPTIEAPAVDVTETELADFKRRAAADTDEA